MAPQAFRYSPFDRQPSNPAADRNAPGRPPASPPRSERPAGRTLSSEIVRHSGDDAPGEPSDLSAPGRHPSSIAETDHAQASLSDTAVGRPVSGLHARRLGDDPAGHAAGLLHLARRLERGYRDARRIYTNAEILSHRLQRDMPKPSAGLAYAVNEHAELSEVLGEAHAFVVRCAAQPKLPEILAALERGEQVFTVRAHDPSVLFATADNRPCQAGVVGSDVNPTSGLPKLLSGVVKLFAGHRKPSTPAHLSAPSAAMTNHRTGDFQSAGKPFQRSGNDRAR